MKYRSNRRFLATISTFVTIQYRPKGQLWFSLSQSFQRQHVLNFHIVSRRSSQHFILFLVAPKSSTKASNNHSFSASISVLSFVTPFNQWLGKPADIRSPLDAKNIRTCINVYFLVFASPRKQSLFFLWFYLVKLLCPLGIVGRFARSF